MQAAHKYGEPKSAYSLVGRWQLGGAESRGRFSTKVCPPRSSPGLRSALWFIASECKTTAFAAKYTAKGDEPQWEAGPPNAKSTQHKDPCVQRFHMETYVAPPSARRSASARKCPSITNWRSQRRSYRRVSGCCTCATGRRCSGAELLRPEEYLRS
jgi:hypothetical protein